MPKGTQQRLRGLPRPPLALVAAVVATLVFALALLAGWATAGSREPLRKAHRVKGEAGAAAVVPLRQTAALPAAPKPRPHPAAVVKPPTVRARPLPTGQEGKLIVGSG